MSICLFLVVGGIFLFVCDFFFSVFKNVLHNFSGKLVPVVSHSHSKKKFHDIHKEHWAFSRLNTSSMFMSYSKKSRTGCDTGGVTSTVLRGKTTSLHLLATVFLRQQMIPLACSAVAEACWWLTVKLLPPKTPRSFLLSCFLADWLVHSIYWCTCWTSWGSCWLFTQAAEVLLGDIRTLAYQTLLLVCCHLQAYWGSSLPYQSLSLVNPLLNPKVHG